MLLDNSVFRKDKKNRTKKSGFQGDLNKLKGRSSYPSTSKSVEGEVQASLRCMYFNFLHGAPQHAKLKMSISILERRLL